MSIDVINNAFIISHLRISAVFIYAIFKIIVKNPFSSSTLSFF